MANLTSSLTVKLIDDVSKPARSVSQALEDAGKQAKRVAEAMKGSGASDKFVSSLSRLKLSARDIETVSKAWRDYFASAKLAANSADWTKGQISGVRNWERQTLSALRAVQREQANFARATSRAMKEADTGSKTRSGGHGRTLGGYLAGHAIGLLGAGYTAEKVYQSGAHLAHERARQGASGMSSAEIMEAAAEAARIAAKFPSIKLTDVNHMLRNARSIVGSYKEAAQIVEPMAKLRVLAQANRPGEDVSEDFDQLVKGLEIKGVTQNPKQLREYIEGIAKGLNVFGDTLKPYQYYEMFKYGRQATQGLSADFILGTAPTLAQELGGSSYGNAVSAFNRAVVGGKMEHSALKELYRIGLAQKEDLDFLKNGEVKGLKPGHSIKGWEVAQSDPNRWVREYFLPALTQAGIVSQEQVSKEVATVFSNKVAAQMVSILSTQQGRINKDLALLRGAPGTAAADRYMRNDPTIAMEGLKNSVEALNATLLEGTLRSLAPAMTDVAKAIAGYTSRLAEAQKYHAEHPDDETLGQKTLNRIFNKVVNGIDSDKAQGALTQSERNEIEYRKQRRLYQKWLTDPDDPGAYDTYKVMGRGAVVTTHHRPSPDKHPLRRVALQRIAAMDAARAATIQAERDLIRWRGSLPRDMSMTGDGSDQVPAGSLAFGMPTLPRQGGLRGASFGFGNYDAATGMPKVPKVEDQTAKMDVDTSSLDAASKKLNSILAQINALRAGVSLPVRLEVQGQLPSIGAQMRASFTPAGDPGR